MRSGAFDVTGTRGDKKRFQEFEMRMNAYLYERLASLKLKSGLKLKQALLNSELQMTHASKCRTCCCNYWLFSWLFISRRLLR
jgi:hypothetical protein